MKNIYKHSALLILLATSAVPQAAAQQTRVLTADKSNEYGLVYTLPLTAIHVELTGRRDVERKGPFYQYARKYLGNSTPVTEDSEKWTLTGADVSTYGVPDTEVQYLMQLKPGAVMSVCVADNGMLLAVNTQVDPEASVKKGDKPVRTGNIPFDPEKEYLKYVNEDFVSGQSLAKKAEILGEQLMEIRDSRLSLTRGTADNMPADGKALELMLASLKEQEEAITAAFNGVKWSETETRGFHAVPEGSGKTVICRLSEIDGFVAPDDLSGSPVVLSIAEVVEGSLPVDAKGEPKKLPKDAVIYNIPGSATVELKQGAAVLYSRETDFAQFGVQFGLAPALFSDKREPYCAVFNPVTGGVVEIQALEKEETR